MHKSELPLPEPMIMIFDIAMIANPESDIYELGNAIVSRRDILKDEFNVEIPFQRTPLGFFSEALRNYKGRMEVVRVAEGRPRDLYLLERMSGYRDGDVARTQKLCELFGVPI